MLDGHAFRIEVLDSLGLDTYINDLTLARLVIFVCAALAEGDIHCCEISVVDIVVLQSSSCLLVLLRVLIDISYGENHLITTGGEYAAVLGLELHISGGDYHGLGAESSLFASIYNEEVLQGCADNLCHHIVGELSLFHQIGSGCHIGLGCANHIGGGRRNTDEVRYAGADHACGIAVALQNLGLENLKVAELDGVVDILVGRIAQHEVDML